MPNFHPKLFGHNIECFLYPNTFVLKISGHTSKLLSFASNNWLCVHNHPNHAWL